MQVVQAVVGVFHHFELAHQLHARAVISASSTPPGPGPGSNASGIARPNWSAPSPGFTPPDFLLARYITRFYPPRRRSGVVNRHQHSSPSTTTPAAVIPACDAFIAISGVRPAHRAARPAAEAACFICDRGSTHQRFQLDLIRRRARSAGRHSLPPPTQLNDRHPARRGHLRCSRRHHRPLLRRAPFIYRDGHAAESKVHVDPLRRPPRPLPPRTQPKRRRADTLRTSSSPDRSLFAKVHPLSPPGLRPPPPSAQTARTVVGAILEHIRPHPRASFPLARCRPSRFAPAARTHPTS